MNKITLKLYEILLLKDEIYGIPNKNIEGLLKQEIPYPVKYWIHDLGKKILGENEIITKLHNELVIKYGDDTSTVQPTITENGQITVNPKFTEFKAEYNALINEEKEIEYKPFKLEDLKDMKTKEYYSTFNKLINV